jgi:hypothetical protein
MVGRFLVGVVKGLIVGGLVGYGLSRLGYGAPDALIAYLAAAATGALVGLVAGKPIWAKGAAVEAAMKAVFGALLGAGLMFAARKWLVQPLPIDLGPALAAPNASLGEAEGHGSLGGVAVTSLAAVAAVLAGLFDADNTPEAGSSSSAAAVLPTKGKRIAELSRDDDDDQAEDDSPERRAKK